MTLPTAPGVTVDYGSVATAAGSTNDWGSVATAAGTFVDWEAVNAPADITSTNQITKPVDKMWAFIGKIENRKDDDKRN